MYLFRVLFLLFVLTACSSGGNQPVAQIDSSEPSATSTATPASDPPTATAVPASTTPDPSPTTMPTITPTPEPTPTPTAVPPTATPQPPTPTPDPYAEYAQYTIEGLRARSYGEGTIEVLGLRSETAAFTRELFAYTSDGLRITGQLTRPRGQGPFPVVVLNHGYFPLDVYDTGYDTQHASDYLAARGYLCLAPDFRSHAGSDDAPNVFRAGHVIDTLNLLPLISQLPDAQPGPIGMWGHSNGGEITTKAILVSDQIAAALIYAPASPELADNYYAFHTDDVPGDPGTTATFPLTPEEAPDLFARLSPINYLQYVQAPVQTHWGTADVPVPREWVIKLHQGLLDAGKQSELFIYEGGTHSLQGAQQDLYLERTLNFFDQYVR